MRILSLRLLNLNSLAGSWAIDFTSPDYIDGGLFVITGPTGVGKTTLLDAVCLALYGRTPRLSVISESTNEIMSRGTAECLAEVVFETPAGRFRCQWSQHRSRKKADGRLQAARHEIVDHLSGRVIESQGRVTAEVARVTGMDFDQFTRSMLLAQGAFAAFLEAPPKERAELLEQITGVGIYSEISMRAFQRAKEEEAKYQQLKKVLDEIKIDDIQTPDLPAEKKRLETATTLIGNKLKEKKALQSSLERLAALNDKAKKLAEQAKKQAALAEIRRPDLNRLAEALKAQKIEPDWRELQAARRDEADQAKDLAALEKQGPALIKRAEADGLQAAKLEALYLKVKDGAEKKRPIINEARRMEAQLAEQDRQLALRQKPLADSRRQLLGEIKLPSDSDDGQVQKRLADMRLKLAALKTAGAEKEKELSALLAGRTLAQWQKTATEANRRAALLKEIADNLSAARKHQKEKNTAEEKRLQAAKDLAQTDEKLAQAGDHLKTLERELKRLNENLQLWRKIQSLEAHRAELAEGRPCPLCGATQHPWADPDLKPADRSLALAEDLREVEKKHKEVGGLLSKLTAESSTLKQIVKNQIETEAKERGRLDDLEKERAALAAGLALPQALSGDSGRLGEMMLEAQTEASAAAKTAAEAERLRSELDKAKDSLAASEKLTERAEAAWSGIVGQSGEVESLVKERAKTFTARRNIIPEISADAAEKDLAESLKAAEENAAQARQAADKALALSQTHEARLKDARENLARSKEKLNGLEKAWAEKIKAVGLADQAAWAGVRLSAEEIDKLSRAERKLAEDQAALKAALAENKAALEEEKAKAPAEVDIESLAVEIQSLEKERRELDKQSGVLEQKQAAHKQALARQKELADQLTGQIREKERWDKLNELIGSSGGQKYRNFAQGLTFEAVVGKANAQLAALSDRYLLLHDHSAPLELKIIDNYQGGEIRSTKNLSGGESFIVSLALALGLSRLASRRLRVDSLFLDEGFGTLDENSLDTVLEALSALKADGKLIGLISHIPALVDRIPTRINVRPLGGPRSAVSGPGVSEG